MKEIILAHIKEKFEEIDTPRSAHFSYCQFPEEKCSCKRYTEITEDTPLISGGFIDSFSMTGVLVFLEKTFKIKIPDYDATPQNFNTVNSMTDLVKKYIK